MTGERRRLAENELYAYALKSLAARASSSGDMRVKLQRRALRASDVDTVLARLKDAGFLNDERYAESFAAWRRDNQRHGKRRIQRDLSAHRVPPKVAQQAIQEAFEGTDEPAMIREHIARRIRHSGPPKDRKGLASLFRHLVSAGFSPALIFPELRRLDKEGAEWLQEASLE